MADFIIVIAAAAMLAGPAPAPTTTAAGSGPLGAPAAGFRTFPDAASCEQAAAALVAPPNARHVCLPVEPMAGDMASAY